MSRLLFDRDLVNLFNVLEDFTDDLMTALSREN
jgi:hypothetical protein